MPAQTLLDTVWAQHVLQSDQPRQDFAINYWTIDIVNHRELPVFLDRQLENYRRVLADIGMIK